MVDCLVDGLQTDPEFLEGLTLYLLTSERKLTKLRFEESASNF